MTQCAMMTRLAPLLLLSGLALSVLPLGCGPADDGACVRNTECGGGEECVDGQCVRTDAPRVCVQSSDCRSGEICAQGLCVSDPGPCQGEGDCPNGTTCHQVTGRCVGTSDPTPCLNDSGCATPSEVCVSGDCVAGCATTGCPSGEACDPGTGRCAQAPSCTGDSQCDRPSTICEGGRCVAGCGSAGCATGARCEATTGRCVTEATSCKADVDCGAPSKICHQGTCIAGCISEGCAGGRVCNSTTGRCEDPTTCTSDGQCGAPSQICVSGGCVAGCATAGCGSGQLCNTSTGRCETASTTCSGDVQCSPPSTICLEGQCRAGCGSTGCATGQRCDTSTGRCQALGSDVPGCPAAGCPAGTLCNVWTGACDTPGTGALGADCVAHSDCASDYCLILTSGGICTSICSSSHQCPDVATCYEIPPSGASFCINKSLSGLNYGTDPVDAPAPFALDGANCHSGLGTTYDSQSYYCTDTCQADRHCQGYQQNTCAMSIDQVTGQRSFSCSLGFTGGRTGAACSLNSHCARGNCLSQGYCGDPCASTADCPPNFTCQALSSMGKVSRACALDSVSGSAGVGSPCEPTSDAPCRSAWCWDKDPRGQPYCTDTCGDQGDCPAGFRCMSWNFDLDGDGQNDVSQPICLRR